MFAPLYENSKGHWNRYWSQALRYVAKQLTVNTRTIHGMVYNAMKLFMEIDPQLFDQCSRDYTESQETAGQREQMRRDQWDRIAEQAKQNRSNGTAPTLPATTSTGSRVHPPPRIDEVDPITRDSQQRFDALRLQDEIDGSRELRRPRDGDRSNEVRGL